MEDTKKISIFQFVALITVSEIMHQYTYLPILHSVPGNQDSWISLVFFIPYVIILCLPTLFLLNRFKNISFFDMMALILGKTGGKIVTFIFCIFFCFCNIACLALSVIFLKNYIFPITPSYIITLAILIPVAYICFKGFKTICRLAVIVFFCILFILLIFFIFSLGDVNFQLLRPIMADSTFLQNNIGGFLTAAKFSDILILFVAAYRLEDRRKTNKVFGTSIILYIVLTLLILISIITMIGIEYGVQALNPYYLFARQVKFYTFLERSEVFVMVNWLSGSILKISIYHYLMSYYFATIFNVKNFKYLVIPVVSFSFLMFLLFGLDKSDIMSNIRSDKIFPWIVLFFILVIPIFIMIVYFIRKKKIRKNEQLMLQQ